MSNEVPKDEPLAEEALVVRFGVMKIDDLRDAVGRCFRALGFYGLSFYGENGLSPREIALLARKPHSLMRKTRVGRIRREGFEDREVRSLPPLDPSVFARTIQ